MQYNVAEMIPPSATYCLFFKYMIKAMKANILPNYGVITGYSKMYPSFYEHCLFNGRYLFPHTNPLSAVALAPLNKYL